MVVEERIFSPQEYLELVTGKCYITRSENDVEFIENILQQEGLELWTYPLPEIDHIVENELDVVLVDCLVWDKTKFEFEHVYRWCEIEHEREEQNERKLIIGIKERLDRLLDDALPDSELDDGDIIEFYDEAQKLKQAIENIGY